jgi:hypothetical protein
LQYNTSKTKKCKKNVCLNGPNKSRLIIEEKRVIKRRALYYVNLYRSVKQTLVLYVHRQIELIYI